MKNIINKKVKFREEFRPFAPSVLEERYKEIFDLKEPSPYMTIACNVKEEWRAKIPATTHINNTARVQTVNQNICAANQSELDLEAFLKHSLNIGYTNRPISKERIANLILTFIL